MVSLKSRSNKAFTAKVVLDGEEHSFEYPSLSLIEKQELAEMNGTDRTKFFIKKYVPVVDPSLSEEEALFLDDDVLQAILQPVLDRYADKSE